MALSRLNIVFMTILVVIAIVGIIPTGEAQLGGLGGIGGLISGILGTIHVQGLVFCTLDGNIGANGPLTPVFPNATVNLQCGNNGTVISTTTTNGAGAFAFVLDPLQTFVAALVNNCSVVVKTPLSTCNVNLPSAGALQSQLKFVGNIILGLLNIFNVIPTGFLLNSALNN